MVTARHSHCYSKCQLEIIIDGYLNMAPYYYALLKVLKNYTKNYEQQREMHGSDHSHPIRIYTKDNSCNKNLLQEDKEPGQDNRNDLRSTYASTVLKYYYLYPLECVVEMLQSEEFYSFLPQNIIINGLFTETNLSIIIETLSIVSEDMSKRIRSTISGKQLEKIQEKDQQLKLSANYISSFVNIDIEVDQEILKSPPLLRYESQLVRTNIVGTQRQINIDREVADKDCRFCQGYLIYLYQTVGDSPSDQDVNRISVESVRCLRLIAKAVTHFTMHLTETGQTHIKNDVHLINKILNTIGLVITEDIYASELNPKNRNPPSTAPRQPKNLLEELQPYFDARSQNWENFYSMEQLFRMIIYCPSTDEVKQQLKQQKIDRFEKDPVLKSYEKEEIVKRLLKQECQQMKQFENQRLTITENTVHIKPIYKQLQFEEKQSPPSLQLTHYNVFTGSRKNTCKQSPSDKTQLSLNDKTQTIPFLISVNSSKLQPKLAATTIVKEQPKNNTTQITKGISNICLQPKKTQKAGKRKKQVQKQSKTVDWNLNSNISTINKVLKRNLLKQSSTISKFLATSHEPTEVLVERCNSELRQENQGLSDSNFRKILQKAYSRNQMHRADSRIAHPACNPSVNNYLSSSSAKQTKKNNGYSSILSQFMGRKQEQQHIECIEKREKQIYNKQLLNGYYVKGEIEEEIKSGKALVYEDMCDVQFARESELLEFSAETYRNQTKLTDNTNRTKLQKSGKSKNIIFQTSTRYNQTGLIRNEKYNKSIKNELINHRPSFLIVNEKENEAKNRLAQTCLKKKQSQSPSAYDVPRMYALELKAARQVKRSERNPFSFASTEFQIQA